MTKMDIKRNEELSFNTWSKEKIRKGKKFCTSRTSSYPDDPNVDLILHLPLWFIRDYLYSLEGADSPEEFQKVINQIFRKEVPDDRMLYVHFGDFQDTINKNNSKIDDFQEGEQ